MSFKLIGAVFIICGCGLIGFKASALYRAEEYDLRQLISALDYMVCELSYRRSALPDLCCLIGKERNGRIGKLFENLAKELSAQTSPDVQSCLASAAAASGSLSKKVQQAICIMGSSLGRFDLEGQLRGLEELRSLCSSTLESLSAGREDRLRSYQTLGLCAGAALVILFI